MRFEDHNMIYLVKPVQAFYDDDQPLLLVLISYRSDKEFAEIADLSSAVYGTYEHPDYSTPLMLVAMNRSTYEQVHLTVESALIADDQFDVSHYYILEGDVGSIISIPGVSEIIQLSDSALLLKTTNGIPLSDAQPLREKVMPLPYLSETIETVSTSEDIPVSSPAENRIIVFVVVITLLAILVSLAFYMIRRRKQDISNDY